MVRGRESMVKKIWVRPDEKKNGVTSKKKTTRWGSMRGSWGKQRQTGKGQGEDLWYKTERKPKKNKDVGFRRCGVSKGGRGEKRGTVLVSRGISKNNQLSKKNECRWTASHKSGGEKRGSVGVRV